MLDDERLTDLADDIKANGLIEPLWLWADETGTLLLLDGRNRLPYGGQVNIRGLQVVDKRKVWWCEVNHRECRTYGYADAFDPCEWSGGRREGHESCGYRWRLIVSLGRFWEGDTE